MTPVRRMWGAALAVLLGLGMGGCVTPATGTDSYRGKASMSVEAAISEVESTRITVQALLDDRMLAPYADETITASETALDSIAAAFGSVQPPVGSDELRETVTTLVSDAEDAVAAARIGARRSDRVELIQAMSQLDVVADELALVALELR
ncbi:MAG TPA: hypothetical protein VIQ02_07325 [Jiangellaceae bacterium]